MNYTPRHGSLTEKVVRAVRDHGPISNSDLARLVGCLPTMSASSLTAPTSYGLVKRIDTPDGQLWVHRDWKPEVRLPEAPVSVFTFRG